MTSSVAPADVPCPRPLSGILALVVLVEFHAVDIEARKKVSVVVELAAVVPPQLKPPGGTVSCVPVPAGTESAPTGIIDHLPFPILTFPLLSCSFHDGSRAGLM